MFVLGDQCFVRESARNTGRRVQRSKFSAKGIRPISAPHCRDHRRADLRQSRCDQTRSQLSRGLARSHAAEWITADLRRSHHRFSRRAGGAQGLFGIRPDLTCLGKILGGGLPLAAFGGRREIMTMLAPEGPVYQAGTLSGNPLAVSAGLAVLGILERGKTYQSLEKSGKKLEHGLRRVFETHGVHAVINRVGSMLTVFFGVSSVENAAQAAACDRRVYASFFHGMLKRGIYFPPSALEASFISLRS